MASKYLDYNGLLYFWQKIKTVFAQAQHSHTKSEITDFPSEMTPSSHTHGNITNTGSLQSTDVAIASGDKLVITDNSNSDKVARASAAFDGSTATKCLTKKGTFEDFNNYTHPTTTANTPAAVKVGNDNKGHVVIGAPLTAADVGALDEDTPIPEKTSDLTNDSGFITNADETDPTVPAWAKQSAKPSYTASEVGAVATTEVGAANGVCPLNATSKIDTIYLPSYVDDVIEAYPVSGATELSAGWLSATSGGSALTPETGKIYVLMADSTSYAANTQFRWGGTAYIKLADGGISSITNAEIDTILAA